MIRLGIPATPGSRLAQVVDLMNHDLELQTLWYMANRTSERAAVNDHGPVHIRTSMHFGYQLLRLLIDAGVTPSCVRDHDLAEEDAFVVVVLGIGLHDVGMSVHRDRHELLSVPIALDWLRRKLPPIYTEPQLTVVISETAHAILAHNVHERTLTLEAGVVKVADALDMTKGRSRRAIQAGKIDIHSISAAAVDAVRITRGAQRPIRVEVDITNPAAVFHLKDVFGEKLAHSSLAPYVEVPQIDELLESLRELSDGTDTHRDHQAAEMANGAGAANGASGRGSIGPRGETVPITVA